MLAARKKGLIVIASVILLAGLAAFFLRGSWPFYKGASLETWIKRYYATTLPDDYIDGDTRADGAEKAKLAIQAIGTNGLPYLLKWMDFNEDRERSERRAKINRLVEKIGINFAFQNSEWIRAEQAMIAMKLLGPAATNALPQLRVMFETEHEFSPNFAGRVLVGLGHPGASVFIDALKHESEGIRYNAASLLGQMGESARPAVPFLIAVLTDTNFAVVSAAADSLGQLGFEPHLCVPALSGWLEKSKVNSSSQHSAVIALGKFGTNAISAVPLVMKAIEQSVGQEPSIAFTNALNKIAPNIYAEKFGK